VALYGIMREPQFEEFFLITKRRRGHSSFLTDSPPAWSIQILSDSLVILAMRRSIHCPQHLPLLILYSSVLSMAPTSLDLGDIFLAVMSINLRSVTFRKAQGESPPPILPPL
jgi:hypothetical protein